MTTIKVNKENKRIHSIEISGHTSYDEFGKDIVCASISSIVTTTVNAMLRIDSGSIKYETSDGFILIEVLKSDYYLDILLENMISLLKELEKTYKKNVKIYI